MQINKNFKASVLWMRDKYLMSAIPLLRWTFHLETKRQILVHIRMNSTEEQSWGLVPDFFLISYLAAFFGFDFCWDFDFD